MLFFIEMLTYILSMRSLIAGSSIRVLNLRSAIQQQTGKSVSCMNKGVLKPAVSHIILNEMAISINLIVMDHSLLLNKNLFAALRKALSIFG